jgi:hypothetical protein
MAEAKYLQRMTLATEIDKRVGFASVKVGDIAINGITVWRSGNGRLSVLFPRYNAGNQIWLDTVEVTPETRAEIDAEVIAAYRECTTTGSRSLSRRAEVTR